MLAAAADCEGAVKQKGCGVISRIYGAEGLGETERVAEKKEKRESGGRGGRGAAGWKQFAEQPAQVGNVFTSDGENSLPTLANAGINWLKPENGGVAPCSLSPNTC